MIADQSVARGVEKRLTKRYDCNTMIKWSYFNTKQHNPCTSAKAKNFGENGLYFESDHDVLPGSTILIKREYVNPDNQNFANHICLPTTCVAEVKWCKELIETAESQYGVGVKYHFPA